MTIYSIMELKIEEANKLFGKISKELSSKYKGKIVAIDADSGNYFIGDSELDAYNKAIKKYPDKKFVFKRIGFDSTHFVGAMIGTKLLADTVLKRIVPYEHEHR